MAKKIKNKRQIKTKNCPCGAKVGVRTKTCGKCKHKFEFVKKIINAKKCPQCTNELRPRAKECDKCKYIYPIKNKSKYQEITNWRSLKPGEKFLIKKGGRGPIYKNKNVKILMAHRGFFTVKRIEKNGIVAFSEIEGFAYIYMGPTIFIEETSIYRRKYKLHKKI